MGVRAANLTLVKDNAYHCIKRRFVKTHSNNDLYYLSTALRRTDEQFIFLFFNPELKFVTSITPSYELQI